MDERITQILDGIKFLDGEYKRDLIDQAVEFKDEITPYLVEILENVRDNPEAYAKDINYFAHNYALMLLGHFKEPKAHGVIVDLFSLPDDLPDMLAKADIYVSASRSDGTSLSLLEAMAAGAFPVVSDIPANREWLTGQGDGLLFDVDGDKMLADCLEKAIRDEPQKIRIGLEPQRAAHVERDVDRSGHVARAKLLDRPYVHVGGIRFFREAAVRFFRSDPFDVHGASFFLGMPTMRGPFSKTIS